MAAETGHEIGADALREVEQTLRAVLAELAAADAWASGRLTSH